ncbi:MAG TPA: DUF2071 domain-containing protein [Candidatus Acidoferrales bacterium]|nr:DUF2071 domain-containing protein [Candidatus Acidoferrales bacterium]
MPVFLTAEWRHLAMLNYEVDAAILKPFVPAGTELDVWSGKNYVSLVGFLFLNTRVRGIPIPFHQNFEELNLRFYVRRKAEDGWRRGVVFIKELVPKAAIAFVARKFYNENYVALPMSHRIERAGDAIKSAAYFWQFNGRQNHLKVETQGEAKPLVAGSEPEFITEHYCGYARQREGTTMEYRVEHPRWRVWESQAAEFQGDAVGLYGPQFGEVLGRPPASAFLAEGSEVAVFSGTRIG